MELQLRLYPDPVLTHRAEKVTTFDDDLRSRVAKMYDIMYQENGVGLAAPQVGWLSQVLILNPAGTLENEEESLTVINPQILKKWGKVVEQEGCLSFPDIFVDIERPAGIRASWQDEDGVEHQQDLEGMTARILLHEMDHLEGVLLIHRMSPVDRIRYQAALEDLVAQQ